MQYKKTNKLANVYGFDPQSGCYSFTQDEREYLSLYDELFQPISLMSYMSKMM